MENQGDTTSEAKEIVTEITISRLTKKNEDKLPEYVELIIQGLRDIPQSEQTLQEALKTNVCGTITK